MTQEQITQLQELKKLLDAGILTPEEMKTEKAKILGTHSQQLTKIEETQESVKNVVNQADELNEKDNTAELKACSDTDSLVVNQQSDDTIECDSESKTNTLENNIDTNYSIPHSIEIEKEGDSATKPENSKKGRLTFLVLGFIILLLGTLFALVHKSNNTTDDEVDYVCPDTLITEQDNSNSNTDIATSETYDDDEFAFDPWIGGFTIDGELYRVGSTVAKLNLSKISKDYYEGKIYAFIGNSQEDGTISIDYGSLEGTIKGKVDGNSLTVVISSYTSKKGNYGDDYFKGSSLKGQVFRIYYNSGSYSVTVLGGMEDLYTFKEETTIKKD